MTRASAEKIKKAIKAMEIAQRSLAKDINSACAWNNHCQIKDSTKANCAVLDNIEAMKSVLKESRIVESF